MRRDVLFGVPKAVIARRCGVSRQSVYNALKAPNAVKSLIRHSSKLDPYVANRLSEC